MEAVPKAKAKEGGGGGGVRGGGDGGSAAPGSFLEHCYGEDGRGPDRDLIEMLERDCVDRCPQAAGLPSNMGGGLIRLGPRSINFLLAPVKLEVVLTNLGPDFGSITMASTFGYENYGANASKKDDVSRDDFMRFAKTRPRCHLGSSPRRLCNMSPQ